MAKLDDILDVAAGNRSLSVSIEPSSAAMVGFAVFIGAFAAIVIAGLIFR